MIQNEQKQKKYQKHVARKRKSRHGASTAREQARQEKGESVKERISVYFLLKCSERQTIHCASASSPTPINSVIEKSHTDSSAMLFLS